MLRLFAQERLYELNEAVCELIETEGMRVHHGPLRDLLRQYGAIVDDARKTVRFTRRDIEELQKQQKEFAKTAAIFQNTPKEYAPFVNDSIPFVYDLSTGKKRYATYDDAIESLKVQHMVPDIRGVRSPTVMTDVPAKIEPLLRYRAAFDVSDKPTVPIGFWDDRLIPYFKEMDRINGVTEPSFFSANMVISPLILDEPTGRKILATAREGYVNRGATPMPAAGGSAPVTVEGTAIIAATEILGTALVLDVVNRHFKLDTPEKITGYCVSGILDMSSLQGSFSAPEAILQDIMVHDMFRDLYHAKILFNPDYTDAKLPGMQCVLERVMKYSACAYAGSTAYIENYSIGNLLTCTVHSPVQMMIDLELGRALHHFFCHKQTVSIPDLLSEIKETLAAHEDSFTLTDITLDHFKENFYSFIIDRRAWADGEILRNEKAIIEQADASYKKLLDSYRPPAFDRHRLNALDEVIQKAKTALL